MNFKRRTCKTVDFILSQDEIELYQRVNDFLKRELLYSIPTSNRGLIKAKLPDVLNIHNWHEFLKSIMNAGYLSGDLILSGNAIYYTYAFYLIAKYRFNVSYNENLHLTSLWFFYASLVSL